MTATSSGNGFYSFNGLAAGSYHLVTRGTPGFIDASFGGTPCPAACNGLNGTVISVVAGTSNGGRNFALAGGGSISGTVRSFASCNTRSLKLSQLSSFATRSGRVEICGCMCGSDQTDRAGLGGGHSMADA